MFFRILGKDLKRKRVMNVILLLFVILSATFASASINNMVSVYGGIDYFFGKAGMSDFVMLTLNSDGKNPAEDIIGSASAVKKCDREDIIFYSEGNLKKDGEIYVKFENPGLIASISGAKLNYYSGDNEPITQISPGHIYLGGVLNDPEKVHPGDVVTLELEGMSREFVVEGFVKDPLFGSPFLGNPRMLVSDEDAEYFLSSEAIRNAHTGCVYFINTDDGKALKQELTAINNSLFGESVSTIKLTYMLDMLTAALMLVVGIGLILISFAMLSFTIKFTLNEDFREIGVMKAVGLRNSSIRGLYLIKYLCIACIGAAIGYACSLPFGELLMKSISRRIMLGNDNHALIGFVSAAAVVVIIVAFCYSCTKGIKKLSPVDAVRNGETGERFNKKSVLRLSKSKLSGNLFLAMNDILSKPRQYASMIVTFTLCILLVTMLATTSNTLMSDKLIALFGETRSDVYYNSTEKIMKTMGSNDPDILDRIIEDIEKDLKDNGMPGKVHVELMYTLPVEFGNEKMNVSMQQCKATKASDYQYSEGSAPMYPNEVAFTQAILDELGARIGDRVFIEIKGEKRECIITAAFSSFNQMGKVGRLHEAMDIDVNDASSAMAFEINFDDHPDDKTIDSRIERMKEIFDTDKIYDCAGYVNVSTSSAKTMSEAKDLVLLIALIISALVTVLMERSFISKETPEIALMKAIGFKTRSICAQHTLRFAVLTVICAGIASILTVPVTKLVSDRIFAIMGARSGFEYEIRPLEIFAVYPVAVAVVVIVSALLTSLYIKSVRPDAMGNIE